MTDFESKVLEVVNRFNGDGSSEFYNGTLFVECSKDTADLIQSELYNAFRCRIIQSKANHSEWSFDFA
jgi:hypothetical protein